MKVTELTDAVLDKEWRYSYGIAQNLVGHGELARDLAQEATIAVWRAWERGNPGNPGRIVYARQAGKWRINSLLGGRHLQLGGGNRQWDRMHVLTEAPIDGAQMDRTQPSVEEQVMTALGPFPDDTSTLRAAVEALPDRERKYILARFWADGPCNFRLERRALGLLRAALQPPADDDV